MPSVLLFHPGSELFGSDRVLFDSASELDRCGWDVTVVLPGSGPLEDLCRSREIRVLHCEMAVLRKSGLSPKGLVTLGIAAIRSVWKGIRLLRRERPDMIYVSTITIPLWILIGRVFGIPVVSHVHEAETSAPVVLQRLMASPLVLASSIVANSQFTATALFGTFRSASRRVSVLPNPIKGPAVVVPPREELVAPIVLLFVGRLSPRKGPDVAIEAVVELNRRGVACRLDLLGSVFDGYEWFEAELRRSVEANGLTTSVRFLGFADEIWPTVEQSDIVLVPSISDEGFGNTAVEAILAARPVVVSSAGGLVEAVAEYSAARIVPPGEPGPIADSVVDIATKWSETRDAALIDSSEASERHSIDQYGSRLDQVLRSRLDVESRRAATRRRWAR